MYNYSVGKNVIKPDQIQKSIVHNHHSESES